MAKNIAVHPIEYLGRLYHMLEHRKKETPERLQEILELQAGIEKLVIEAVNGKTDVVDRAMAEYGDRIDRIIIEDRDTDPEIVPQSERRLRDSNPPPEAA